VGVGAAVERGIKPARIGLLWPLTQGARADNVAKRIARAIQLGLLPEGEQLPSEAEFAAQMGVSTMTLREAFSILRDQGLVETRRGRTGGTFVQHVPEPNAEALWQRLAATSVTTLRDLADAQFAAEGSAAYCAAERAPQMTVRRLFTLTDQMGAAATRADLIRADSRFHIEVAIASQSERLLRSTVELQTESGDLLWTPHDDAFTPEMALQEHRAIAEAIAAGDGELARAHAQDHVQHTLARLIGLHRASGARSRAQSAPTRTAAASAAIVATLEPLAAEIRSTLSTVFDSIDRLSEAFHALRSRLGESPTPHELQRLDGAVRAVVEENDMSEGAGYVFAPGYIGGYDRYIQWLHRTAERVTPLRFNLDPTSVNVYDYLQMDWYTIARDRNSRCVYGPFLDFAGADHYVMTFTAPLTHEGTFLGLAGADLRMAELEHRLMEIVDKAPGEAVLINSERAVLAANTPRWVAGSRLTTKPKVGGRASTRASGGPAMTFTEVQKVSADTGWVLALAAPTP
jgi:DNA-binding FadR family transcriptional regulator